MPPFGLTDKDGVAEVKKRLGSVATTGKQQGFSKQLKEIPGRVSVGRLYPCTVLGMGGSSLAPEVFRLTFGVQTVNDKPGLDVTILDFTDPRQVAETEKRSSVEKTLFIVSSKSGGTSEVMAMFNYFCSKAEAVLGKRAGEHFIVVTDAGTSLEKLAKEHNFRRVFTADPNVGGRYSALTAFGLVPAKPLEPSRKRSMQNSVRPHSGRR